MNPIRLLTTLRCSMRVLAFTARLVLRASFRASPGLAGAVLAVALIQAVLPVALAWTVREIVDGLAGGAPDRVHRGIVIIGVVALGWVGAQWVSMTSQTVLEERTDHWLEQEMTTLVHAVPDLSAVESPDFQDQVHLLGSRPRHLVGSISTIIEAVALVVRFAAAAVLLGFVAPALVPLPLLVLIPVIGSMRVERGISTMLDDISTRMRTARLLFLAATDPASAAEVRQFGMTDAIADRQDELLRSADRRQLQRARSAWRTMAICWGLFGAGVVGMLWLASKATALHGGGVAFLLAVLALQLVGQAEQAALTLSKLSRLTTNLERFTWLREFVGRARARYSGTRSAPLTLSRGIEFRNVSFRHTQDGPLILQDVNLRLPAGSVVALAGHNGAGKTTLVKLLLGLYTPTTGQILIDGVPLSDLDEEDFRRCCAVGYQDFCRFELLAGDTVGVGDLSRLADRSGAVEALTRAGSADVIDHLREGLETPLGLSMPDASMPSEGQWQKLALGRAMMRTDPVVRVLDEPTASLDAESEAALFRGYLDAGHEAARHNGCITILVSHRFATVRAADLIVVLREGRITETGIHAELIASNGWYARVCTLQASSYG